MEVYGLIGDPVDHSLSPTMHEAAYQALEMDARYVTFAPAREDLATVIAGADALGIAGLNVTTPFKQAVIEHVDPDETAATIGAVNTISFTGETPHGTNTDAAGARRALTEHGVVIDGAIAVVVGAGGAGRAIAWALAEAGATVRIANRSLDRAEALAATVGGSAHPLAAVADLLETADLLVNATTVGMDEDRSPVPSDALHADLTVMDAVYDPLETRLLREAAAAGADTIDGAWMLLYQGATAFERWTGREAPIDAMNTALRDRF